MTENLTPRQQQVLDLIRDAVMRTGYPPTRAEIAKTLGFRSANAAEEHLRALARKGAIEMVRGTSRGIRLLETQPAGLPLVGRVAAGAPILAEENIEDYFEVPASMFRPAADYFLRVHGDSMKDGGILDGDLLAVHRRQTADNGELVVARLGEEVTVKRLKTGRDRHTVTLMPENADYEPIVVDLRDTEMAIEGVGVGVIRTHG